MKLFLSKYRVPDIQKVKSKVQGVIYIIDKQIEKTDSEDYPNLYIKKYFYINKKNNVLLYERKSPQKPSDIILK